METQAKTPLTYNDICRMDMEQKLKRTDFFVEADSFAQDALWDKYVGSFEKRPNTYDTLDKNGIPWLSDGAGFGKVVGNIGVGKNKPVTVDFRWVVINGKYICFYHACSRFVDWDMVEGWITKHFPIKYDNGTRRAMCDAGNFHNCYNFCRE